MEKKNTLKGRYKKSMSSRKVFVRDLPLEQSVTVIKQGKTTLFNAIIGRCRTETFRHDNPFYINGNGFTLIELLVVVLIIGILAAVALPKYQVAVEKTRAMNLLVLLRSLQKAQQAYYLANDSYADDTETLAISYPAGSTVNGRYITLPNQQRIVLTDNMLMANTPYVQFQLGYQGNAVGCWATDTIVSSRICTSLGGTKTGSTSQCSLLNNQTCYGYRIE